MLFNKIKQWFGKKTRLRVEKPVAKPLDDYHSPSTYSTIACATNLLSSSQRKQKILTILKENVHLAAICEAQAFERNESLYQQIIYKAQQDFKNQKVVNATFALLVYNKLNLLARYLKLESNYKSIFKNTKQIDERIYNIFREPLLI